MRRPPDAHPFSRVNETVHDLTGEWLGYSPEGAIAPAPTAASPVVLGFDGRQAQLGGAAGTSQQILSLPNSKGGLKWSLAGRLAAGPASVRAGSWRSVLAGTARCMCTAVAEHSRPACLSCCRAALCCRASRGSGVRWLWEQPSTPGRARL